MIPGILEFNFPSLDPFFHKYGKAIYNSSEIHAEIISSNITGLGLSKLHFYDVRTQLLDDKFHLEIDVLVPKFSLEGDMNMNGTIGIFKIVDNGMVKNSIQFA